MKKPEQKKPRSDSKLKNLPEERQAAIEAHAGEHGLVKAVAWLREDGLETSVPALSVFLSWRRLNAQFREDDSTTESLIEQLKAEVPGLSEEQLDELGQRTFSLLSMRRQDLDGFVKVRSARSKGLLEAEKLKLRKEAEARLQQQAATSREQWEWETCNKILKAATDVRTREIAEMNVPNEEKIKLLRRHWFADVDELEKSGGVTLPPLPKKKQEGK